MSLCRVVFGNKTSTSSLLSSKSPIATKCISLSIRHRSSGQSRKRPPPSLVEDDAPRAQNGQFKHKFAKYESPVADFHLEKDETPVLVNSLHPGKTFTPRSSASEILSFFEDKVVIWVKKPEVTQRLTRFAVPSQIIKPLLDAFKDDVRAGKVRYNTERTDTPFQRLSAEEKQLIDARGLDALGYGLPRFARYAQSDDVEVYMDMIYNTVLYAWASSPVGRAHTPHIPASVLEQMSSVSKVCSPIGPRDSDCFFTRSMRRRFILHVGPTNSGKTHNALRALAAAPTGVYAGPLRLLAHEIWERLNLGQIIPLGVDESQIRDEELESESNLDVGAEKVLLKKSANNLRWARQCNMITGEEVKVVSENAGLVSCTVEMLGGVAMYDVAVIDEIQLIADADRGFAWSRAVMSLNASEIHLCGEATAIPVVQALIKASGDDLVIKEYHRLNPLEVQDRALNYRLDKVRKGDCLVTFSRSKIFEFKARLQGMGISVATIYGKLPPEVRSTQASLFNSGELDVLVGSDAVGMGLNLKIRRMIFTQMAKNSGSKKLEPLSVSSVKQIAGRAGRYGMHAPAAKSSSGSKHPPKQPSAPPPGLVTTLIPEDLPFLQRTMALMPPDLPTARVDPSADSLQELLPFIPASSIALTTKVLPEGFKGVGRERSHLVTLMDIHRYTAQCPPWIRYSGDEKNVTNWERLALYLEGIIGVAATPHSLVSVSSLLSFDSVTLLLASPMPFRDHISSVAVEYLLKTYTHETHVLLDPLLRNGLPTFKGGFKGLLETVELHLDEALSPGSPKRTENLAQLPPIPDINTLLQHMESFNGLLSLYIWLYFRRPINFPDSEPTQALLPRVQTAIHKILSGALGKTRKSHGNYDFRKTVEYQKTTVQAHMLAVREKYFQEMREKVPKTQR